jgi:hypothetical protein
VPKVRVLLVALTVLAGCSSAPQGDDGASVGESQDHLLAGRRLAESEIARLIREAGFPESAVGQMVCTAKYESSFYERASHKNGNGTTDYGLFQINSIHLRDAGCPTSVSGLYDAASNARCAYHVYRAQGIRAWYGYQKHKSECDRYRAPGSSTTVTPDDPTAPPDDSNPYAQEDEGNCWSGTLSQMVEVGGCVESQYDGAWYQCNAGKWYAGGGGGRGPYGACTSSHPLR